MSRTHKHKLSHQVRNGTAEEPQHISHKSGGYAVYPKNAVNRYGNNRKMWAALKRKRRRMDIRRMAEHDERVDKTAYTEE